MKRPDTLLQQLPSLGIADAYFCFLRSWWDDTAADAAVWWRDGSGCYRHLIKTGETFTPKPPYLDEVNPIKPAAFEKLLREMVELGVLTLPQQPHRIAYTHYDHWYGLKLEPNDPGHWLGVQGGIHSDRNSNHLWDKVFKLAPELRFDYRG